MKIAVIGCGRIAQQVHLRNLQRMAGAEAVALADPDPRQLEAARRLAPRAALYEDYGRLLAESPAEAVLVSAPAELHAEIAVRAFERVKHVYLEKPLAVNMEEGRRVVEAWRRAGTLGMIGFNFRFNRLARRLRAALEAGPLTVVRSVFASAAPVQGNGRSGSAQSAGVLLDLASHHIDLARFLFRQEVSEVFARIWSERAEADCATLELTLTGGLRMQSFFSHCASDEDVFEVSGQSGKLVWDRYFAEDLLRTSPLQRTARLQRLAASFRSLVPSRYFVQKLAAPWNEPSFREALEHFTAAVHGRCSLEVDLLDGLRSLAVAEAARESAATGRTVSCRTEELS